MLDCPRAASRRSEKILMTRTSTKLCQALSVNSFSLRVETAQRKHRIAKPVRSYPLSGCYSVS